MTDRTVANVTCLGCGCACDDITVVVTQDRIADARNACALGTAWFGDGTVPAETRVNGRSASLEQFYDAFVTQGLLPIPLIRKILLR